jgi:hypothetical protein
MKSGNPAFQTGPVPSRRWHQKSIGTSDLVLGTAKRYRSSLGN